MPLLRQAQPLHNKRAVEGVVAMEVDWAAVKAAAD